MRSKNKKNKCTITFTLLVYLTRDDITYITLHAISFHLFVFVCFVSFYGSMNKSWSHNLIYQFVNLQLISVFFRTLLFIECIADKNISKVNISKVYLSNPAIRKLKIFLEYSWMQLWSYTVAKYNFISIDSVSRYVWRSLAPSTCSFSHHFSYSCFCKSVAFQSYALCNFKSEKYTLH